jgi:hypothetical protein
MDMSTGSVDVSNSCLVDLVLITRLLDWTGFSQRIMQSIKRQRNTHPRKTGLHMIRKIVGHLSQSSPNPQYLSSQKRKMGNENGKYVHERSATELTRTAVVKGEPKVLVLHKKIFFLAYYKSKNAQSWTYNHLQLDEYYAKFSWLYSYREDRCTRAIKKIFFA